MPDGLLPRRLLVDGLQRQRDFNEFLFVGHGRFNREWTRMCERRTQASAGIRVYWRSLAVAFLRGKPRTAFLSEAVALVAATGFIRDGQFDLLFGQQPA